MRSATWSPCTTSVRAAAGHVADRYAASDQGRLQARRCLAAGPGPRRDLGLHDLTGEPMDDTELHETARRTKRAPACTSTGRWAARSPRSACRRAARDAARDGHAASTRSRPSRPPTTARRVTAERGARRDAAPTCCTMRCAPTSTRRCSRPTPASCRPRAAATKQDAKDLRQAVAGRKHEARRRPRSRCSVRRLSQVDAYAAARDRARRHRGNRPGDRAGPARQLPELRSRSCARPLGHAERRDRGGLRRRGLRRARRGLASPRRC